MNTATVLDTRMSAHPPEHAPAQAAFDTEDTLDATLQCHHALAQALRLA